MKMDHILKQAKKLQAEMARVQEELANEVVEGSAGGGLVKVKANGQGDIVGIDIDVEVIDPEEKEMLEDLILAAISDALTKSRELAQKRMGAFSKGFGLPGIM
ncbi:YbaB/EbfC family nucleoid-associated protein [Thermovirga lienii]|uniref:YbaB/EbfC family nucleoid-associated protein n=1 Tax=Thermovirga lienii TaxID=336261 RepID=UPI000A883714|nr:YbaB/EbfC family nucleoid-associated protein [Thermovirga lienii]